LVAAAQQKSCDFVVVGAGAAGCVVAARLSEDPDREVVLLEAGPERRNLFGHIPVAGFLASVSPRTNWNFQTEPVPALGGRTLQWNQGRTLGGSSSINGMLYMRGHSREYDQWAQMGCTGWSFDDVLPYFKKAERSARGASRWHGDAGPLPVRPSEIELPICREFLAAMSEAGYPTVGDINTDVVDGFGHIDVNVGRGRRVGTADAYIAPIRSRPNLTVITQARATRIRVEAGHAKAVEYRGPSGLHTINVDREVVLCGGAVNSPQLLLLSGIGPADELRRHGIDVVLDQPRVGRNLHNHPAFALQYALAKPLSAYSYLNPVRAIGAGLRYAATRRGPFAQSYIATGGVFRTEADLEVSDIFAVMIPALTFRGGVGAKLRDLLPQRHGFVVAASLGRPASRGSITLASADPASDPVIRPDYFSVAGDIDTLAKGLKVIREAMRGSRMRPLIAAELQPQDSANDLDTLRGAIRKNGGTFWHPGGTCKMGMADDAVVDPRLRVRGIVGLRVADASVMPNPLNASTHAPVIMIGEKAAAMIRQDNGTRLADAGAARGANA
jgi:choline dehydrogenase